MKVSLQILRIALGWWLLSGLGWAVPEFLPAHLEALDAAIQTAVASQEIPGAVVWIERGERHYTKAYGSRQLTPKVEPMTPDTIFDLASLTKIVATTPAVLKLLDAGRLKLDERVSTYLPEFAKAGHETVKIRHLLTHTSGLPTGLPPGTEGYDAGLMVAYGLALREPPGTKFVYSDVNFILLGEMVRRLSGQPLNEYVQRSFYEPLGMADTLFTPLAQWKHRIAPTEMERTGLVRGVVHDPTSRRMGGITGHAGCFSTAADLAKYARFWLAHGATSAGKQLLQPSTVALATSCQTPAAMEAQRGLGWDLHTGYSSARGEIYPPTGNFGHTGWTGTSLWIDPASHSFVILLTNRNHPTEQGQVHDLRIAVATQAALAMGLVRPEPASPVLNGIDVLKERQFTPLQGLRVGLITNQTGRSREGESTIDLLAKAPGVQLKALFSPEHGIRGQLDQEQISDTQDAATGLPIYSLYQKDRKPTPAQLQDLDVLVFDIQDIGCRFYTYIGTMLKAMEASSQAGLRFMVLDRINPLSGLGTEGPISEGPPSFTAIHPLPVRHGLTVGELAKLMVAEQPLKLQLEVIPVRGWQRAMWQDQTGLQWTNPSPNMRSLAAATLYPGLGLVEFTNVSVGRGTETPFAWIGAPWIDSARVIAQLQSERLAGVAFAPVSFTPQSSTHAGKLCQGVRFIVFDRTHFHPLALGMALARALHQVHPGEFTLQEMDRLLCHPSSLQRLQEDAPLNTIFQGWEPAASAFAKRSAPFLLYPREP